MEDAEEYGHDGGRGEEDPDAGAVVLGAGGRDPGGEGEASWGRAELGLGLVHVARRVGIECRGPGIRSAHQTKRRDRDIGFDRQEF